ncbi:hypothetical protein CCB80_04845 [Armatimonadetes bacterium Uphvl-Ar1]|nr:hypothetical protein CCB80_04845 [Armatimonadetes bacterium Uphvl-Ar1]
MQIRGEESLGQAEDYIMIWIGIAACYLIAAGAFYTLAAKTAAPAVELRVVEGGAGEYSADQSRAA